MVCLRASSLASQLPQYRVHRRTCGSWLASDEALKV